MAESKSLDDGQDETDAETLEQARERFNQFYRERSLGHDPTRPHSDAQQVASSIEDGLAQAHEDGPSTVAPASSELTLMGQPSPAQTLPPMFVPGAVLLKRFAHIGINSALLQPEPQGLVLMVQRYPGMQQGDCLEVFWQDWSFEASPVFTHLLQPSQIDRDVAIYLPVEKVVEGVAQLYCRVSRNGVVIGQTRPVDVLCKPSLPGGPDLVPEESWHSGLAAPEVAWLLEGAIPNGGVDVIIPPWRYMQAGGVVQLMWGTSVCEPHAIRDDEVDRPVPVRVPASKVRDAGSGVVPVRYRIIDVVGDISQKWSAPCHVNVQLQPGLCDAPRLLGAIEAQELDLRVAHGQSWPVLVWGSARDVSPGDEIDLHAVGVDAHGQVIPLATMTQSVDEAGKGFPFSIPGDWMSRLACGSLRLSHQVRRAGRLIAQSNSRYVDVKGLALELPFAEPTGVSEGGLDPELSGTSVKLHYPGMAQGDRIKLYWHGQTAERLPYVWEVARSVSNMDAKRGEITMRIAGEHIQALDHGSLQLRYSVNSDPLAAPLMSPRLWLRIGELVHELPAPSVEGLDAENDLKVLPGQRAVVTVDAHSDIQAGDSVSLCWSGANAQASLVQTENTLTFQIPADVLAAGLERPTTVTYTVVSQADRRVRTSAGLTLTATAGQPLMLGAPQVVEAGTIDGSIDPLQVPPEGATVLFQSQAQGLRPDDRVILHVSGVQDYQSLPLAYDPEQPLSFLIPARIITINLGGTLSIRYSVNRGGRQKSVSAPSEHFVRHHLNVDKRKLLLNGVSVKYPAWQTTGNDSIDNTAVRAASGGSPPYTYTSSKPSVASVDNEGKVTGNANGNAVITISDQRKFSVSYEVQVSNVWDLNIHTDRAWRWTHAVEWMNGLRGRPATAEYIADLQRVYGAPLPVPRYLWNCVKVNHNAGMFYHHAYAMSCYFCSANTPNTNIYGGMCVTERNG